MELTARESTSIPKDEMTVSTSAWSRDLETIQAEITYYQEQGEKAFLQVGRLLLEAKVQFAAPGKWLEWLRDNTSYTPRTAQRLMRIASYFMGETTPVSQLGVSKAYILCQLSPKELDHFLECLHPADGSQPKSVANMTKRELEQAVRQHLEEGKRKRTAQIPKVRESPTASPPTVQEQMERLRKELSALSQLFTASEGMPTLNKETAAELCELCRDIVRQLAPDLEDDLLAQPVSGGSVARPACRLTYDCDGR